jgi:hypothetical protein
MKERPIIFSAEMVRAILDGRKTQTRRLVKGKMPWLQPFVKPHPENGYEGFAEPAVRLYEGNFFWYESEYPEEGYVEFTCPHGVPGDRLGIIKDTWLVRFLRKKLPFIWRFVWRSFVEAWAEIEDIRVERVQDISDEDAKGEGVFSAPHRCDDSSAGDCHRCNFRLLWNSIYAKKGFGWDVNPWVWAITFKQVEAKP